MNRLADDYFQRIYENDDDPWGFDSRWYEKRKYAMTLAALPREHYGRAFEPGCASGALSESLAPRCDELIATELVARVAERARTRLARFAHVRVETAALPEAFPDGLFDLVVLSEVVYYLTQTGATELMRRLESGTSENANVVAVHYLGTTDYPLTGEEVHALLRAQPFLRSLGCYSEESFMLEVFTREAV